MSKSFDISASNAYKLSMNVLNKISAQEAVDLDKSNGDLKNILILDKTIEEINKCNKKLVDVVDQVNAKVLEFKLLKQKELDDLSLQDLPEEEKEKQSQKLANASNKEIFEMDSRLSKELGLKEVADEVITVEVSSEERFVFLKQAWNKFAAKKIETPQQPEVARKIISEINEAIESAK